MQDSSDIIRENNYILREIKQFKKRILPENIEIIQNITKILSMKLFFFSFSKIVSSSPSLLSSIFLLHLSFKLSFVSPSNLILISF